MIQYNSQRLSVDPWLTHVPTFDLHLPSYRSHKKNATLTDHLRVMFENQKNRAYNVVTMWRMAKDNAFPGVKVGTKWSPQLFRTQSTSSSAWLAPFRKIALETYKQLNEAVANRDDKTIRKLTAMDEQLHYLKLARQQDPSHVYVWKFLGERSPCRVLSIRANMGHMGPEDTFGSKLLVQALVKFDTLQGLEVYRKGKLVHTQEPKPVVEYLVLQKRLWLNSPWVVRDRAHEGRDSQFGNVQ